MAVEAILDFEKPILELERRLEEVRALARDAGINSTREINQLEKKLAKLRADTYQRLSGWQTVQLARHPRRPYTLDYVERICSSFQELHGDRAFADDHSIVAGLGRIGDTNLAIIGHQKGRDTKSNIYRNFGMPQPEGYRKALRVMQTAERFGLPVLTLVDTSGAYPGLGAEARGQAEAIARNLFEMARLKVPIVTVVVGEGGSGGALALAVADRVLMFRHSIYSVISPEGCASILFRDAGKAQEAAEAMQITAGRLLERGIVDEVLDEPEGGAHRDWDAAARTLQAAVMGHFNELSALPVDELVTRRIAKFDAMGEWELA